MAPPICSMRVSMPPIVRGRSVELAEIPVPAGDGDHGAGRIDARALDDALVDGALETEHRPAHVANGGEAAHQGVRRFARQQSRLLKPTSPNACAGVAGTSIAVPMRVDQARHQRAAAAIDDRRVAPPIDRDRRAWKCARSGCRGPARWLVRTTMRLLPSNTLTLVNSVTGAAGLLGLAPRTC